MGAGVCPHPEVDADLQLRKGFGELQIRRCVEDRIRGREQHQRVDDTRVDVGLERREIPQSLSLRLHGEQRLAFADVTQREVDLMGDQMHRQRLARAGQHHGFPGMRFQIGDEALDPSDVLGIG